MTELIQEIKEKQNITLDQLKQILSETNQEKIQQLYDAAAQTAEEIYGKNIFIRGLIEFTNYCKNDCFYCGIRRSNKNADRYRLSKEEILSCCENGYELGFRTFVLQGGEDPYFTDDVICDIVSEIRRNYPDCAITLSIGEKEK